MPELLASGAALTAVSAIAIACIKRSRCKLILSNPKWSFGIGFTEVPLKLNAPKQQESAPAVIENADPP